MYFNKTFDKKRKRRNKSRSQIKGSHKRKDWEALKKRCGNMCLLCERDDLFLTKDHIVPICKGGTNHITNVQPVCFPCNKLKDGLILDLRALEATINEWFPWLASI